jgi:ribonuclease P protein component
MNRPRQRLVFRKERRLTRATEFARVKAEGESVPGRFLVLGVLFLETEGPFRAGIVTSRKIGIATTRNRVRRRIRDILRTEQARVRGGVWLVVIARPPAAQASYRELRDEWLRLAERASILAP